jgi:hypothetical protein
MRARLHSQSQMKCVSIKVKPLTELDLLDLIERGHGILGHEEYSNLEAINTP